MDRICAKSHKNTQYVHEAQETMQISTAGAADTRA